MALVRWEPAREIASLQSEMNRLFSSVFDTQPGRLAPQRWVPAMDLVESGDHFILRADLPGLSEEDVSVEVERNVLTVSGERKYEHEADEDGYYRIERGSGSFSRSLTLPESVDPESITAKFDKGVLEVRIPKPEEAKPHRVAIETVSSNGSQPAIEGKESDS
jgi:HSP20 family protein